MKEFKIKYQKGFDILIQTIKANDIKEAMYLNLSEAKKVYPNEF